jgi:hypothetical protein
MTTQEPVIVIDKLEKSYGTGCGLRSWCNGPSSLIMVFSPPMR